MNGIKNFSPRTAAGLSLVELMISITLVSIIMAGVVKLYSDSHRSFLSNEGVARTQEGIRYVLDHIGRSAARAGYMGCAEYEPADPADPIDTSNVENLINVAAGNGQRYDFDTGPVFGTDNAGPNGSDTLVLRSATGSDGILVNSITPSNFVVDGTALENSGLESGDVLLVSDCKNVKVFMMTNDASSSGVVEHAVATINGISNWSAEFQQEQFIDDQQGSVATLFPVTDSSVVYSIGNSAAGNCTAATPEFCALLANNQELLQGVENLQVLYGQQSGVNIRYREADDPAIDWRQIVSVEITVTLNSVDNAFSQQAGGGGDGLVRKVVSHVVALRNGNL